MSIEDVVEIKRIYYIRHKSDLIVVGTKSELKADLQRIFGDSVVPFLKKMNQRKEKDLLALVHKLNGLKVADKE